MAALRVRMPKHDPVPLASAAAGNFLEDLGRDLRYAARTMRKNPLFVLFVVATLALGIGANTTVFSVINTLILNPLPVPDSFRALRFFRQREQGYRQVGRAAASLLSQSARFSSPQQSVPLVSRLHVDRRFDSRKRRSVAAHVRRIRHG